MTAEYWLMAALGAAIALGIGFFIGRRTAPTQHEVVSAQKERDEACAEVDRVRDEVTRHFEQSANMFGRLAEDYRSFFEHFAQTAQNLGVSEGRTRELLRQADPRLVADQSGTAATGAAAGEGGAGPDARDDETEGMGVEAATPQSVGGEETLAEEEAPAIAGEPEEAPGDEAGERDRRDA